MFTHILLLISCVIFVKSQPNFVLILTDDQDLILNGLLPMKNTLKLVADTGKVFSNSFVNSPICCPSRSTILTGKYAHNTGVVNNSITGNCASKTWQRHHEPFSIASILKDEGYVTFYAGKYLNQYGSRECGGTKHVPKGYDWWIGLKGNSRYYNYTLSVNGSATFFRDEYLTDVLGSYSVDFLNNKPLARPFFMAVAPPAAHAPFTPANRHRGTFPSAKALRNPSFNHTPTEKHWIVRMPPMYLPDDVTILDNIQRHRLQSLLAVDEMIAKIVLKLRRLKVLDDTYIIFISDNGFHIGQFTQPWDKRQPYETDVRVPMIVSGPEIPKKTLTDHPVALVDFAPTILDLANVTVPPYMDGTSFKAVLFSDGSINFNKRIFVEYWGEGSGDTIDEGCPWTYDKNLAECSTDEWCKCQDSKNNTYTCVITLSSCQKFKFCHFKDSQGFVEAYDLNEDPYELVNVYKTMEKGAVDEYFDILDKFEQCSGVSCRI